MTYRLDFEKIQSYEVGNDGINLDAVITYLDASVDFSAKIDTGAAYSIFERSIGERLGLNIEKGIRQRFGTATGIFYAFGFRVLLSTAGFDFDSMVFFAADESYSKNVLGRIGWLDQVVLGLVDYEGTLYLSKYSES